MYRGEKGFTLVELSIVIVIIGLIVAGVIGGQALVRQAKIKGVVTEVEKYRVALNSFRLEYNALPGDFENAQSFWGAGTVTNGDGNRLISAVHMNQVENLAAFEHLTMAGLIEGTYNGVWGGAGEIGVNIPRNPYSQSTSFYFYGDPAPLWGNYSRGNSIVASGFSTNQGYNDYQINVKDAYGIDVKLDDGKPLLGSVVSYNHTGICTTLNIFGASGTDINDSEYRVSNPTDVCSMHFGLNYTFR